MITYKIGDLLKATENVICHQVNADGVMGGGLALQIANTYPSVENIYKAYCKVHKYNYEEVKGKHLYVEITKNKIITNCFTQKPNFDTDYQAINLCFTDIFKFCKKQNFSLAIPYKYGCGIANGNWEDVETIIKHLAGLFDLNVAIYRLEEK